MSTPRTITVVIADDEPDVRLLLRLQLEGIAGVEVVGEAGDGIEAIEMAQTLKPDLILLDIAMPRLDGLQAIPRLHEVARGTRIIVFTGFENEAMARQALELCASAVLSKGFPLTLLTERISQTASEPPKEICLQPA